MTRRPNSSASMYTKVSLYFQSPASEQDPESTTGAYVCSVPNHLLKDFMERALQIGGKLEKKEPNLICYRFSRPGSFLAVEKLAKPYMF